MIQLLANEQPLDALLEVETKVQLANEAQRQFEQFSQQQVDKII